MNPTSSGRRHVPPRQTMSPEQSVGVPSGPSQHGRSISPHAIVGSAFTQVAVVTSQASDGDVQGLAPSQHASPSPPHDSHMPSVQTTSPAHVNPSQQRWPGRPQVSGIASTSPGAAHTPELVQTRPSQQSDEPPHDAMRGAQQRPELHASPRQQSDAESHPVPEPGWMQQMSPRPQSSPSSQMRPTQQVPPDVPHGPEPTGPPPSGFMVIEESMPPLDPSGDPVGLSAHPGTTAIRATRKTKQASDRIGA